MFSTTYSQDYYKLLLYLDDEFPKVFFFDSKVWQRFFSDTLQMAFLLLMFRDAWTTKALILLSLTEFYACVLYAILGFYDFSQKEKDWLLR